MAKEANSYLIRLLLFFTLIINAAHSVQEATRIHQYEKVSHSYPSQRELLMQNSRRIMIGSTAPTCTYNECRGCKYKCRAEQVPVEGNDPMNSAYHYKCVCHREKYLEGGIDVKMLKMERRHMEVVQET